MQKKTSFYSKYASNLNNSLKNHRKIMNNLQYIAPSKKKTMSVIRREASIANSLRLLTFSITAPPIFVWHSPENLIIPASDIISIGSIDKRAMKRR